MLVSDLTRLSLRQIYRNKRRYKGVVIGIALGLAGFVTVLTMGDSVESDVGGNLELLGAATILKATWDFDRSERWHHGSYSQKDLEDLRQVPGVAGATPVVWSFEFEPTYGTNKATGVRLLGVEPSYHLICNAPVSVGRPISVEDFIAKKSVCVLGRNIKKKLFNGDIDPLGKTIFISGNQFRVVGIIGGIDDVALPDTIIVPITVARTILPDMYHIRTIYVRTENWDVVERVRKETSRILARNQPNYAEAMIVDWYPEALKHIKRTVLLVKLFLYAALGAILLIGALGITNVMLAAVRERTTEIGLRKAVGATDSMIMTQFLMEGVGISLMGAALGIILGTISVEITEKCFNTVPAYSVFVASLFGSLAFGVILGVVSGMIPAKKASELDVAEAMRFE
ncbi:MAG TPA: ABC transporter permease [Desulfomonilaceae bacterium]|nr:ABC transporter permease [Desulfomonilaceae bacterium]